MWTTDILTLFCPVKLSLRQFVKVSGGMQGGSAPPAFQRAEQQRLEEKKKAMIAQGVVFSDNEDPAHGTLCITQKALKRKTGVGSRGRGQGRGRGRGRGSVKQIEECKGGEGNDRNGEGANSGEAEGDDADTTGVEEEEVEDSENETLAEFAGRQRETGQGRGGGQGKSQDERYESGGAFALVKDSPNSNHLKMHASIPQEKSLNIKPLKFPKGDEAILELNEEIQPDVATDVIERPVLEKRQLVIQPLESTSLEETGDRDAIEGPAQGTSEREGQSIDDEWMVDGGETLSDIDDEEVFSLLHSGFVSPF
jgi:hypothetical protein